MNNKKTGFKFSGGIKDSIPIALGYFAVSFGFGITVVNKGLSILTGVLISLTNVTSAGQLAGLDVIVACGAIWEMILCQFIINIRYSLMGISLTQKLDNSFNTFHRMIVSFFITDEIFGVASSKDEVNTKYMYGLGILPIIGWTSGTFCGAFLGDVLPDIISNALGIAIYGMFIAIVMPVSKKNKGILIGALLSASLSVVFDLLPLEKYLSSSTSIVICAVVSAIIISLLFPVKDNDSDDETKEEAI